MTTKRKSVITIATGKSYYLRLAWNLARSYRCWHDPRDVPLCIVTDLEDITWPSDLMWVRRHFVKPGELGLGFSCKLQLDWLSPAERTLFLDADCLVCGNLEPVFERFRGFPVGVVGADIHDGEWFGDIAQLRRRLQLGPLPKFNGGLYYLESGDSCERIFARARALEPLYDDLGLVRLRNRPNDELLMAISLAEAGLVALPDDGSILGDPQACRVNLQIDVSRGRSRLTNPPAGHPLHQAWYPVGTISPLIVHLLAYHTDQHPYRTQALQLKLMQQCSWPRPFARIGAEIGFGIPARLHVAAKDWLRPIYHRLFGVRAIKPSQRAVA